MRLLYWGNDGGPKSTVWGFWLVELKRLFSVVLLRFGPGSREEYHDHAFTSINWLLRGTLLEQVKDGPAIVYRPSLKPIITRRDRFHRVSSDGNSWVFSLRGPWKKFWSEWNPVTGLYTVLTNHRKVVNVY